jgi:FlgD Ig-like domain
MKICSNLLPLLLITLILGGPSLAQSDNINTIGGFEGTLPSYWTKGSEPAGATLTWATDQSVSFGRSLEISKSATSDSAAWISQNMCDIWSPRHYANVDMKIGAWVKTQGVNTNPATNDDRWYVAYTFYDSAGALIGQTKLPIDQSVATSTGWLADTNGVSETVLPTDSWKTIITFVAGKNATGTVWADNFILIGRAGAWAGQDWNTGVGVPTGWNYWLPPLGGNDGDLSNGFENTMITSAEAHSGMYSLKFDLPFDREPHDAWVGTRRYLLNGPTVFTSAPNSAVDISQLSDIKAGDVLRISMWIKGDNLVPDSAALYPGTWAIGVTPIFHTGYQPNDNYDEVGASDYTFTLPNATSFDWKQFSVDVTVPDNPDVKALSIRPHVYARFTGTVYYDDVTVEVISTATGVADGKDGLPKTYELATNYPNPFNPSTNIRYAVPHDGPVVLSIYNILGARVRTLVDNVVAAGKYSVVWDGRDDAGMTMGSGVYFYRLEAGSTQLVHKMMLLK